MSDVLDGRLTLFVGSACVAILVITALIPPPLMILVFNGLLLSVAGGVMVAYAPVAIGALRAKAPSRGDFLGLGIFLCWTSVFSMRLLSILARELGHTWLVNTHWVSVNIALALVGGVLHLLAPDAIEGRVPRERWVSMGILVSGGLAIAFLLLVLRSHDIGHPTMQLL